MIKVHWLIYLIDPVWQGLFYNHLLDWFICSLSHWVILSSQFQYIINPKPVELETWKFGSMFTLHHVSHVTWPVPVVRCQVSGVICHVSDVTCIFSLQTNLRSLLVDGLLSMGPTTSSLQTTMVLNAIIEMII